MVVLEFVDWLIEGFVLFGVFEVEFEVVLGVCDGDYGDV